MTIDQKVEYLGNENFVRIGNVDSFKSINPDTRNILKQYGVYSNEFSYPYLTADKSLQSISIDYIKFGETDTKALMCIDVKNNDRIVSIRSGDVTVVNSGIKTYIECLYTLKYFSREIEWKNALGEYSVHRKKYAQKLLAMFNEVEGNIENFPIWYVQVYERELGSL